MPLRTGVALSGPVCVGGGCQVCLWGPAAVAACREQAYGRMERDRDGHPWTFVLRLCTGRGEGSFRLACFHRTYCDRPIRRGMIGGLKEDLHERQTACKMALVWGGETDAYRREAKIRQPTQRPFRLSCQPSGSPVFPGSVRFTKVRNFSG